MIRWRGHPAFIMLIEICYTYQEDKKSPVQTSWLYFNPGTTDFDKAVKKAQTHFKKFVSESGYGRKAKLKEVKRLNNDKTETPNVVVGADELAPARSSLLQLALSSRRSVA